MNIKDKYEVIIIGGSYAGLSAAMALGRSVRYVLIIDSGLPCNRFTPHSHNFLTQDGETPAAISAKAKAQVMAYPSVKFKESIVTEVVKRENGFEVNTASGKTFTSKKIVIATGVTDIFPSIDGFAECWGKTVIHCPYCHGYEVRQKNTAILANGDGAMHYAALISQLTGNLSVYTNGPAAFESQQKEKLAKHNIAIIEGKVTRIHHDNGQVTGLELEDGKVQAVEAIYARPEMKLQDFILKTGVAINDMGFVSVDEMQRTSVPGLYASGDCTTGQRAVAVAVASGMKAGAAINYELASESF
jgi:thioredoxin reductase